MNLLLHTYNSNHGPRLGNYISYTVIDLHRVSHGILLKSMTEQYEPEIYIYM